MIRRCTGKGIPRWNVVASDGVIEGGEMQRYRFLLARQNLILKAYFDCLNLRLQGTDIRVEGESGNKRATNGSELEIE